MSLTTLHINSETIRCNLLQIRGLHPNAAIMPMIKADAYGTDSVKLAQLYVAEGVELLAVAFVLEGIHLRKAGITGPILISYVAPHELPLLLQWNLTPSLFTEEAIATLAAHASKPTPVHLQVDLGMTRLGCPPHQAAHLANQIQASQHLVLEGIWAQLPSAADPAQDPLTNAQASQFEELTSQLPLVKWRHLANTAFATRFNLGSTNLIRPGIGLLQGALTLTSQLIAIHDVNQGDRVSYGGTYTISEKTGRIGVIPCGYYDGLRLTDQGGLLTIKNSAAPIVGTICMDFCMVDVSHLPHVSCGDAVTIFDPSTADSFAKRRGETIYQLISGLGPRVQRSFQ